MRGKPRRASLALALAALLLVPLPSTGLPDPAAPPPPQAPGPLPNTTLPGGNLTNGSLPGGNLTNGSLPGGNITNGSLPLPGINGSGPLDRGVPHFTDRTTGAGLSGLGFSRLAWGDFDADGFDDIMFNGGALFHNNRDGTFSDVSFSAGTRGDFTGGAWGDYNNDGRLDFYATAWRATWDTLFRNNGDGTFTNVTAAAGMVKDDLPTEAAAWADYDRDGCLDLYAANYEWPPLDDEGTDSQGTPNILWHNDCDGTFENATVPSGAFESRRSRGVVWGDFNNDDWPDLYVSNYRLDPNEMWINSKNGTFTDRAMALGVDCDNISVIPNPFGACGHSIGADAADLNNDGDLDLYVANLAHPQFLALGHDMSQLLVNRGAPNFEFVDRREEAGIRYCETASDPTFADFDANGRADLFITSIYENRTSRLYLADGTAPAAAVRFNEVSEASGLAVDNGWGAGWSDYDRDGDIDLAVGSSSGVRLFSNDGNGASYIELELKGRGSNRAAIGARVFVEAALGGTLGATTQMQEVQGGDGTGSQSSLRLFFGLADFVGNASVQIRWPSGLIQNLTLAANAIHQLEEPEGVIDLAVTGLAASPANPIVGGQVELTATVESVGTAPPNTADIVFYRGGPSTGTEVGRKAVGKLVGSQNFSVLFSAPASPGPLTLSAQVEEIAPPDQNPLNDAQSVTVTVRSSNEAPTARLNATPPSVEIGDSVLFDGSGSTDDSAISQYIFDFGDGDSALLNDSSVSHAYREGGTYTARLTVVDDNGEPSQVPGNATVTVLKPGQRPPTAVIDSVNPPSPEMLGANVVFEGHGVATDASITAYEWASNIDGPLSDQPLFQTDSLTLGPHTVSFRVQDSNGVWSEPVTTRFLVVNTGGVQITFIGLVDDSTLSGTTTVRGAALPPAGVSVTRVEWRVDLGNLQPAIGADEWSFSLNAGAFPQGPHDITVVVTDSDNLKTTRTVHVLFGPPVTQAPGQGWFSIYLAAGIGSVALAVALYAGLTARRRKAKRTTAQRFARLPVVSPPPPIRPLPVPPVPRPGGPPKRRVKVVAKRPPSAPGTPPFAPPPSG